MFGYVRLMGKKRGATVERQKNAERRMPESRNACFFALNCVNFFSRREKFGRFCSRPKNFVPNEPNYPEVIPTQRIRGAMGRFCVFRA
jgi:hypothetical protein